MINYTRECPNCGKELTYKSNSGLKSAIRNNTVCISCSQKGKTPSEETRRKMSEAKKGEKHPNYGKTPSEETRRKMSIAQGGSGELNRKWPGMIAWARRVKERDDYICQHCHLDGLPEEMEAHHIVPRAKFPQYAYDLGNGQTLCRECHRIEHNKKPNYPWGN